MPQRRNILSENTPAEKAIYDAMQEVEKAGADIRLTEVVSLLSRAREVLADYVDDNQPLLSHPLYPKEEKVIGEPEFRSGPYDYEGLLELSDDPKVAYPKQESVAAKTVTLEQYKIAIMSLVDKNDFSKDELNSFRNTIQTFEKENNLK